MKRGPGRPKLPKGERLEPIVVRLPPATVAALDDEAAARNLTRAELLRELLLPGILDIVTAGGDRA